jgi:aminomuconate-semialdehyde/2-hydroxymuconate-6-semialdehyde dehydrogenase
LNKNIMLTIRHFIDGKYVDPASGQWFDKFDPATAAKVAQVPDGDARDVDAAVAAARIAFPKWSRTPTAERARMLLVIADRIDTRREELALAESIDGGKPLKRAREAEIPRAAANFRYFAAAVQQFHSEAYRTDQLAINYTLRQPHGVAGLLSPWNLPLYLFTWKVAPALATGNTVVAKPSELTPTTAHLLTEIAREAGLPAGVFNVVHGYGHKVGAALVAHPDVPAISYTGGTAVGAEIAKAAAPLFKRLTLELGGKNPNIIFADADPEPTLQASIRAAFDNQGEICLCGSRIFVEEPIYQRFVEQFVAATKKLKVGDPLDAGTDQGALISQRHLERVLSYINLAKKEGGRILCGGKPPAPAQIGERCRNGAFLEPTVVVDLDLNCRVNQEEIFGPVVTIAPFRTESEVIRYANASQLGLSASLWTNNLSRAHRVAEQLKCGTVWVNCWLLRDLRAPFGGVKQSGVGREGGEEALRFFTEAKTVCVRYEADANK